MLLRRSLTSSPLLGCSCLASEFDGQMVGISSVSGRHLGTPKRRVLNFLAGQHLIYLVPVTAILFYLFLMSAFFQNKC